MRKEFTGLVDTLRASVLEIAASGADNREELLTKSIGEFSDALGQQIVVVIGDPPMELKKGLNHISSFASALNRMNQTVAAMKTGRPAYMLDSDSNMPPEQLPEGIVAELDRFMRVGIFTLKTMVNDSAELPDDDADLQRAEKAGELLKIETDGDPLLFKSQLPPDFHVFFEDPVALMVEAADLGRELLDRAIDTAEDLLKGEIKIPRQLMDDYPEIFVPESAAGAELGKAFPPKKKPDAAAGDKGQSSADSGDEALGDGAADQGQGEEPTDITDDTPQDPIQMCIRLMTMGVVILSGLQQGAMAGDTDTTDPSTIAGSAQDPNNVGLQRGTPIETTPLAKILDGSVTVDASLADALIELETLRKQSATESTRAAQAEGALGKLQEVVARLKKTPGQTNSVLKVMPVTKSGDSALPGQETAEQLTSRVDGLLKRNPEGDSAAALLISSIHRSGGTPLVPPG